MYFATTTKLDILNNRKNHIFISFHSSEDYVAKMSPFNNGCHVNTWWILKGDLNRNDTNASYWDTDANVC